MRPRAAASILAAALAVLVGAYLAGARGWPVGLGAGAVLGFGLSLWIRFSVARAFSAAAAKSPQRLLLWHGTLRLGAAAAALYLLLKLPGVPLWAVLTGYTLVQAAAWWSVSTNRSRSRAIENRAIEQ